MIDIREEYKKYCELKNIKFDNVYKVNSYDESTLFCPAGMQQFKTKFRDESYSDTEANIQACIRMNDFDEVGDTSHLLYFNMMGLFSFREMSIDTAIDFWMDFVQNILGLKIDYATVHPDRFFEWKEVLLSHVQEIKPDVGCIWSDGKIGGYCTEFYIDDIEIGNIVNPLDNCIDVGFGLERLNMLVNKIQPKSRIESLSDAASAIINSGYKPSNLKQGYVLRKILREIYKSGSKLNHVFFEEEVDRQNRIAIKYNKLKDKFNNKPKEWWFDTHGITLEDMD